MAAMSNTTDETTSISAPGLTIVLFVLILLLCSITWCVKPRNCTIIGMNLLQWCYRWCPVRLNCASKLDPDEAILRYQEDPPHTKDEIISLILSNDYIKSMLHTLAVLLPEYFFSILPSGSLREGFGKVLPSTAVLASDYDVMLIPDSVLVGEPNLEYRCDEKPVFATIETPEIPPGYIWLRLENTHLKQWEKLCIERQTKGIAYSYLSSHRIHSMIRDALLKNDDVMHPGDNPFGNAELCEITTEQNGPAFTVIVKRKRKLISSSRCDCCRCSCCVLERDDVMFYCDFTVALHCPRWPIKSGWFDESRRKNWPSQKVVNDILQVGCHVVPKPSTNILIKLHEEQPLNTTFSQSPGLEWRYSFSQPEILLSENVAPQARSAYLALKAVNKRHISKGLEKGLPSYTLKCLLFRFMEEKDGAYWETIPTPIEIFVRLLDSLHLHLVNGFCPHYWIEEINLFSEIENHSLMSMLDTVRRVSYQPQAYIADNWLELTRCLRHNCCECCSLGMSDASRCCCACCCSTFALDSSSCPLCLVPCSYNNRMTCFGPCSYHKLNFDVY